MNSYTTTVLADLKALSQSAAASSIQRVKLSAGLTEFPIELYAFCQTLEILDLSDNQLSALPDDLWRFRRLTRLFLTNNHFRTIPAVLAQCPALIMLSFKGNQLAEFASGVLPENLQWLILTDNQLRTLPDDFGRYQQLKKLALAGNQLRALPDSMQQCRQLGLLRLSLNCFEQFPDWLFSLPHLAWLALGANPACPVPEQADQRLPLLPSQAFVCLETLGEGASGVIYRAQFIPSDAVSSVDTYFVVAPTLPVGTEVALKRFKGWITSDGCPKDELQNYLNAGAHPNLIPVLARVIDTELPALAMTLIPKEFQSLGLPPSFDSITRDTFDPKLILSASAVLKLALQLASVLSQLHQRKIMHGDLYAHNVLSNSQRQLYLGDFGAATALDGLSLWQQQQAKALEIRAFGYFLADVLALLPADQLASELILALQQLCQQCLLPEPALRPVAASVHEQLLQLNQLLLEKASDAVF
jgi:hypothetical protein